MTTPWITLGLNLLHWKMGAIKPTLLQLHFYLPLAKGRGLDIIKRPPSICVCLHAWVCLSHFLRKQFLGNHGLNIFGKCQIWPLTPASRLSGVIILKSSFSPLLLLLELPNVKTTYSVQIWPLTLASRASKFIMLKRPYISLIICSSASKYKTICKKSWPVNLCCSWSLTTASR